MQCELYSVALAVDASGDQTVYTENIKGRVAQVRYIPDGTVPLDTGADITITSEVTGVSVAALVNIGTSAFTKALRQATYGLDGAASLFAVAGLPVQDAVYLAGERLKIVVAQGGVSKKGTLYIWVG